MTEKEKLLKEIKDLQERVEKMDDGSEIMNAKDSAAQENRIMQSPTNELSSEDIEYIKTMEDLYNKLEEVYKDPSCCIGEMRIVGAIGGYAKRDMLYQIIERYWSGRDQIYKSLSKKYEEYRFCTEYIECLQNLNDSFAERLKASDYTDDEVTSCMSTMDGLIHAMLRETKTDILYDGQDYDNMAPDEIRRHLLAQMNEFKMDNMKLTLSVALTELKAQEFEPKRKAIVEIMDKKIKEHPEIADMTLAELEIDPFEGYDHNLGCTRIEAQKLEELMETEYQEYDVLLGRRENGSDSRDGNQSKP